MRSWKTAGHGPGQHPRWPEISTVINSELDALYSGDKSAEAVGTEIAAQVDAILGAE